MSTGETPEQRPHDEKPLFLLRNSPLVSGGKARLMSGRKVEPKRAQPRDVSGPEAHGYTTEPSKALAREPECLSENDWDIHVGKRGETNAEQQRRLETRQREDERRRLTFEQRLVKTQAEARRLSIDVSGEMRLLRHMQAKAKDVRHLEQRLGTMERKVFRDVDLDEAA